METRWNKTDCAYLLTHMGQTQNLEETLELRLTEQLPDIGRILCAWGQGIVRSKQCGSDAMTVSGGVNATVLYLPEDGTAPNCVEAWLPFGAKWNLPQRRRGETVRVNCLLSSLDARVLSARKMLLKADVSLTAEALEPTQTQIAIPEDLPTGIEVLQNVYPVVLPKEAGEKNFSLEEQVSLPGIEKWTSIQLHPEVTEQTVVGSRVVLRGIGHLYYGGLDQQGQLRFGDLQIPFAQYADLDWEYQPGAMADVMLCVSAVEAEPTEDGLSVHCSLMAQYLIKERVLLEVTEDAYSPNLQMELTRENLQLPVELDDREESLDAAAPLTEGQVIRCDFLPEQPRIFREGETLRVEIPGRFQVLCRDSSGEWRFRTETWCGKLEYTAAENVKLKPVIRKIEQTARGMTLTLGLQSWGETQLPMISGISVGEPITAPRDRPALLLRPMDTDSLWELAKATGSTMAAIRAANQLTQDPQPGQMLLIPMG